MQTEDLGIFTEMIQRQRAENGAYVLGHERGFENNPVDRDGYPDFVEGDPELERMFDIGYRAGER